MKRFFHRVGRFLLHPFFSLGVTALVAVFFGFIGCEPQQSPPATIDDVNQLQRRVDAMSRRVATLEQAVTQWSKTIDETDKSTRQARADQSVLIEDLRTELKNVKGSVEILSFNLKETDAAAKKFKEDIDLRLNDIEAKLQAGVPQPAPQVTAQPKSPRTKFSDVDDTTQYNRILRTYIDGKNDEAAIEQFGAFLGENPRSTYAPNAQYWISEAWFRKGEYARAVTEYQKLIDKYPKHEKVCDAVYKQGLAFLAMKDASKARLFFTEVKSRCPKTSAAAKAQRKLSELAPSRSRP